MYTMCRRVCIYIPYFCGGGVPISVSISVFFEISVLPLTVMTNKKIHTYYIIFQTPLRYVNFTCTYVQTTGDTLVNTAGGMGKAATTAYKRLASLLANKREQSYSTVKGWMRCHLSFSLLRSAIMCLRRSRSKNGYVLTYQPDSIDTIVHEAWIPRVH